MHAIGVRSRGRWAHLARLHQLGQRSSCSWMGVCEVSLGVVVQRAKGGHMALRPVDLAEVDHIGLQAAQAAFARGNDVRRCHALAFAHPGHATRRASHLGGQHQLWRAPGSWQNQLPMMVSVAPKSRPVRAPNTSGRVDEVDAARQRVAEDGVESASLTCSPNVMVPRQMGSRADRLTQCDVLHAVQTPKAGATCGAGNAQGRRNTGAEPAHGGRHRASDCAGLQAMGLVSASAIF